MTEFLPLILAAAWCLLHLAAYLAGLRDRAALRTERGILLFHAIPTAIGVLLAIAWIAGLPESGARWAGAIGAVALLAIYAMSFLELWSLAEGSYSLSILALVAARGRAGDGEVRELARIGARKQQARTGSLRRLRLVREGPDGRLAATGRGRVVAALSAALLWLSATERAG